MKWKKSGNGSYVYGIDLEEDEAVEEMIISELKARRRTEVINNKTSSDN